MEINTLPILTARRMEPCRDASRLSSVLDTNGIVWNDIEKLNWPEAYPYRPRVQFRIAHCGDAVMLNYRCAEQWVRALADDNGRIWEDSCVEFFVCLNGSIYYNVEFNCAGKMLMGGGSQRKGRTRAGGDIFASVKRSATLTGSFDNSPAPDVWELAVIIPVSAFFLNNITDICGCRARANFYKCGDLTPIRHYLSWAPVDTPAPNFHTPEFFGNIIFE